MKKYKYRLEKLSEYGWLPEWSFRFKHQALKGLEQAKKDRPEEMFRVVKSHEWW